MDKSKDRIILDGGNVNGKIEKIGEVIYRQSRNLYLHEFYQYMEKAEFKGVPRFLGVDETNREKLSYVPGYVPGNSFPNCKEMIWSDENLIKAAAFIKSYHDMSAGFVKRAQQLGWQHPLFNDRICEVICHNDAAPYNFVYQDDQFAGMIDFDEAYPATRIWDIVYTLYTTIPLAGYQPNYDGTTREYTKSDALTRKRRIKLFFDTYGIECPNNLFDVLISRLQVLCDLIENEANAGKEAFIKMVEQGEIKYYLKEITFIKNNYKEWL